MFRNWKTYVILAYEALFGFYLVMELHEISGFRATDQVIILTALLFAPFLLLPAASMVRRLTVKAGGQEVAVEFAELERRLDVKLDTIQGAISGRITTAEQILVPIVGGKDTHSADRIKTGHLIIGSKQWASQRIMAEILAQQLEHVAGIECERRIPNGGTLKNYTDMTYGRIDCYVEYTGTACFLLGIDHREEPPDEEPLRNALITKLDVQSRRRHKIAWLQPLGVRANYLIFMGQKQAKKKKIKTLEELAHHAPRLTFGGEMEFMSRDDGFIGLRRDYRLRFRNEEICGYADRYDYVRSGRLDVSVGWETEPELEDTKHVKILEDPRQFFADQWAVPLVRVEALDKKVGSALRSPKLKISHEKLTEMAEELSDRGMDPDIRFGIAKRFLEKNVWI